MATMTRSEQRDPGLLKGGTDGNRLLTVGTGALLFVLLGALGVTILLIGSLIEEHLFIGLVLVPPVLLKLASTGWRFARYYTGDSRYVKDGPPALFMRLLGPLVVLTTVVVFASGILLMFEAPHQNDKVFLVHKASFILWIGVAALHVIGHIPEMVNGLGREWGPDRYRGYTPGRSSRAFALVTALVLGVVLAIVLAGTPHFAEWQHYMSLGSGGDH